MPDSSVTCDVGQPSSEMYSRFSPRFTRIGMFGLPPAPICTRSQPSASSGLPKPKAFGFGSPDDAEGWDRVQIGAGGNPNMPILVNRGENREYISDEGWPTSHVTDESGMRESYHMWKKMMTDD